MAFVPLNTNNSLLSNYNSVNDSVRNISNKIRPIKTPDKAWRTVGATNQPAFTNSWVNYGSGYNDAQFYKDALGFVHLRGLIKSGTVGAGAFTLPVGYRPGKQELFGVLSNAAAGRVDIQTSGVVFIQSPSNNAWVQLDGITFWAEQ